MISVYSGGGVIIFDCNIKMQVLYIWLLSLEVVTPLHPDTDFLSFMKTNI